MAMPIRLPAGRNKYLTYNGQLYADKDGAQDTSLADDHSRHVRQVYVPWGITQNPSSALIDAARAFVGAPLMKRGWPNNLAGQWANSTYFSRPLPMPHPSFPGIFYAESLSGIRGVKPMPNPTPVDANRQWMCDEAELSLVFGSPMHKVLTDGELVTAIARHGGPANWFPDESSLLRNVFPNEQTAGKYQTLPSFSCLKWTGPPFKLGTPVPMVNQLAVIIPESDLTIMWGPVPLDSYPAAAIKACIGCTNQYPLGHPDSFFGTYPAGTLTMLPPGKQIKKLLTGDYQLFIAYKFKIYPEGANFFYRWDGLPKPGFQRATRNGLNSGPGFYPDANFNDLFRPEDGGLPWSDFNNIQEPTYN